jgi:hypothetical protein
MFSETKLVFKKLDNFDPSQLEIAGNLMDEGKTKDESIRLNQESENLRSKIEKTDIFAGKDLANWRNKLNVVKNNLDEDEIKRLNREFDQQKFEIEDMIGKYTQKVLTYKEKAFAVDKARNLDTAQEFVDWFKDQSIEDKRIGLTSLDSEIHKRIEARNSILKHHPELKQEIMKLRQSEMQDKMEELNICDVNIEKYNTLLEKHSKYFNAKSIQLFQEDFEDKTPFEQEDYIRKFNKEILAPRMQLTQIFESLPKKYQNLKFFEMSRHEKQDWLNNLETNISKDFEKQVKGISRDVWSDKAKKFSVSSFIQHAQNLATKAQWLDQLPTWIEAEKDLAKQYRKFPKAIKELVGYKLNIWEKLSFEDKQDLLNSMDKETGMMKEFTKMIDKKTKDEVISGKTKERYLKSFKDTDFDGREEALKNFETMIMPRKDLFEKFKELSKETQKQFAGFLKRGHRARLKIYQEALKFEEKLIAKKTENGEKNKEINKNSALNKENETQSKEKLTLITKLKSKAEQYEKSGNLERAIGIYESMIDIKKADKEIQDKIKELEKEIKEAEASKREIEAAISKEMAKKAMRDELENIKLAQKLIKDREEVIRASAGNENLERQVGHIAGASTIDKQINEHIIQKSKGEKMIGRQGRVKKVHQIDINKFGKQKNDGQKMKIKEEFEDLAKGKNLENITFVDENTGKNVSMNAAKQNLRDRRKQAAKNMANRAFKNIKVDKSKSQATIKKSLEEEIMTNL